MARKYLIVVDMQEDFINGSLGSKEAREIVQAVTEKVKNFDGTVLFTRDHHGEDYGTTQEGKFLPVPHCIAHSAGWEFVEPLEELRKKHDYKVYEKGAFGSIPMAMDLRAEHEKQEIGSIELVGVCTDICVVSNALILKAYLPEVPIYVDAECCAGVTPEKHQHALETMKSCQVIVHERRK